MYIVRRTNDYNISIYKFKNSEDFKVHQKLCIVSFIGQLQ